YDQASLKRLFTSLQELDTAVKLSADDKDIQHFRRRAEADFLNFIGSDYTRLLNSAPPTALLPFFQYAQILRPEEHFFQELLGVTYLRLEQWTEAARFLQEAATRKPDDVAYLSNLAYAYDQLGKYADALEVLQQAYHLKPEEQFLRQAIEEMERKLEASSR
ncbi:MAG: tetratricopeptide repeat protein, partial [Candidatus Binatia bacterium]